MTATLNHPRRETRTEEGEAFLVIVEDSYKYYGSRRAADMG